MAYCDGSVRFVVYDVDPDVSGVRVVVFEGVTFGTGEHCIGEMDVHGSQP